MTTTPTKRGKLTLMARNDPFKVLNTQPPVVTRAEARQVLAAHYGWEGELVALRSERDLNFAVTTPLGIRAVLKISNSAEAQSVTRMQASALLHVEQSAPDLPVPRNLPTVEGNSVASITAADKRRHSVRLLSWLDGVPVDGGGRSPGAASMLGDCLARIGCALKGFEDPAADYTLLWDLKNSLSLTRLLDEIDDRELRKLCGRTLARFEARVSPKLDTLRWQVIHNDLNPGNVLIDPASGELSGVIDFGDTVRSPLVIDVAVASAYLLTDRADPLNDVCDFVRSYCAVRPLTDDENTVLFNLILTRLAMTILIARWRAARYPENRDYILCSEPEARAKLATLGQADEKEMTRRLADAGG